MKARELKKHYLDFFISHDHKLLPNVSLVPENDPTALFISAGMHPLVPYLLGESHSLGKRLVSVQRCLRTGDIDEVGDANHHTFFEMLGNWSLGDYFKKEAISWSFEFLTSKDYLGIDKENLAVSVFGGDENAPFDKESYDIWLSLGIAPERIAKLPRGNNWWGPIGDSGPCGPDTEMFVWTGEGKAPSVFDPSDSKWVEIWNDVFMQYHQTKDGSCELLKQKNVDTGMGVERTLAILNGLDDDYKTDVFWPIIEKVEEISGKKYEEDKKDFRVIADHLKAAVFIANEGILPSNTERGYVLRRLIRRAVRKGKLLKIDGLFAALVAQVMFAIYEESYPDLQKNKEQILTVLTDEEKKFQDSFNKVEQYRIDLEVAIKNKLIKKIKNVPILSDTNTASGAYVYENYQSYGVPPDLSKEVVEELGLKFNQEEFDKAFKEHQKLSRTTSSGMFKGGLAEGSEKTVNYHTATHLLQSALRKVLGNDVRQKGSNITNERLRFDFSYPQKLNEEQLKLVEDLVNEFINKNFSVEKEIMSYDQAIKEGALTVPGEKYPEKVNVYIIDKISREVCGGPHADFTGKLGKFKILKEESVSAGVRRIYAILE